MPVCIAIFAFVIINVYLPVLFFTIPNKKRRVTYANNFATSLKNHLRRLKALCDGLLILFALAKLFIRISKNAKKTGTEAEWKQSRANFVKLKIIPRVHNRRQSVGAPSTYMPNIMAHWKPERTAMSRPPKSQHDAMNECGIATHGLLWWIVISVIRLDGSPSADHCLIFRSSHRDHITRLTDCSNYFVFRRFDVAIKQSERAFADWSSRWRYAVKDWD